MTLTNFGYGAGSRDLVIPNVLRVLLGDSVGTKGIITESLTLLETNIDDESPELTGHLTSQLLEAGALDVTLLPAQMKKGRPGVLLQVLAKPAHAAELKHLLFHQSSTLGVRDSTVQRDSLPRRIETVETSYGRIRVKIASLPNGQAKIFPEYEDCRIAAAQTGTPLRDIYHDVSHHAAHALHLPHDHHHHHHHHEH